MLYLILTPVVLVALFFTTAYVLSHMNFCFTRIQEGTAKAIMKGEALDYFMMRWRGHYLNDPRRSYYDPRIHPWEVLKLHNPNGYESAYKHWQWHWRALERVGIFWFGLSPFKERWVYRFKWQEMLNTADGAKPWFRDEYTDFIFVKGFTYWIKLQAAEDKDNEPLDLDYLLTTRTNNPKKALFDIDDWLGRMTADANNAGKIYVGFRPFNDIKREVTSQGATTSEFAKCMLALTHNVVTQPDGRGTSECYGITVDAASLVDANPAGVSRKEIIDSFSARIIAERNAQAAVATAKGTARSEIETAKGTAQAARIVAKGNADAIETVYRKVDEFGEMGLVLQQLDALKTAEKSPATNIIWANDPLGGLAAALRGFIPKSTQSQTPPAPGTTTP